METRGTMCDGEISDSSSDNEEKKKLEPDFNKFLPLRDIFGVYQKSSLENGEFLSDWKVKSRPGRPSKKRVFRSLHRRGIVTTSMIASNSSYIDRAAVTTKFARLKCNLSGKILSKMRPLKFHHYLAYLDLSWNKLKDLQFLGNLPHLMYLDVSHNQIVKPFFFKPPHNLLFANFSYNNITICHQINRFWSIVELDLSHNTIGDIDKGFIDMICLRKLNLSYNDISEIKNLEHLYIAEINLDYNDIQNDIKITESYNEKLAAQEPDSSDDEIESEHSLWQKERSVSLNSDEKNPFDYELDEVEEENPVDELKAKMRLNKIGKLIRSKIAFAIFMAIRNLYYSRKKKPTEDVYLAAFTKSRARYDEFLEDRSRIIDVETDVHSAQKITIPHIKFGLNSLDCLTHVEISYNRLRRLSIFRYALNLIKVIIYHNLVNDLHELKNFEEMRYLIEFDLRKNPIQNDPNYIAAVFNSMKHLQILDGQSVELIDKIKSEEKHRPNVETRCLKCYMKLRTMNHLSYPPANSILPYDKPPNPMIVVVSLMGSRLDGILDDFIYENKGKLKRLKTFVTRMASSSESLEENCRMGIDQIEVSEDLFELLISSGRLINISEKTGFGVVLSEDAITHIVGKIPIISTDLTTALLLKFRGLQPTIIMAIPETERLHSEWLYSECSLKEEQCRKSYQLKYEALRKKLKDECIEEPPVYNVYFQHFFDDFEQSPNNIEFFEDMNIQDYLGYRRISCDKLGLNFPIAPYEDLKLLFHNEVLNKRRDYLYFRQKNLGVIEKTIFTNKIKKSRRTLNSVLNSCLRNFHKRKSHINFEEDPSYKTMTANRMKLLSNQKAKLE